MPVSGFFSRYWEEGEVTRMVAILVFYVHGTVLKLIPMLRPRVGSHRSPLISYTRVGTKESQPEAFSPFFSANSEKPRNLTPLQ